ELILPELFAGFDIEGAQIRIHRGRRENQATSSYDGSSQVDRTRLLARNHLAERSIPDLLARKEINCLGRAPGWSIARQLAGGKDERTIEAVGCTFLFAEFAVDTVILLLVRLGFELLAGNQPDPGYETIRVRDHYVAFGIIGRAAPVHATHVARQDNRTLKAGWGENTLPSRRLNPVLAPPDVLRSRSPCLTRR